MVNRLFAFFRRIGYARISEITSEAVPETASDIFTDQPSPPPRRAPRGKIIRVGDRRYFCDTRGVWWRINSIEGGALIVGHRHLRQVIDMQRVGERIPQ